MRPTTTYPAGWLPVYLSACQPPLPPARGGQTDSDKDKSNSFLSAVNNSESSGKNIVLNARNKDTRPARTSSRSSSKAKRSKGQVKVISRCCSAKD